MQTLSSNVVDILRGRVFPATVRVEEGRITAISPTPAPQSTYLLPGFVDAHVHIESSMLTPPQFARAAVMHGTVAAVSDPHEIGNVLGIDGVQFMLDSAAGVPFKFFFGAPSCVPATAFETAGATITASEVAALLADDRIGYLSEMMNYPGVLDGDPEVLAKLQAARNHGKPIDGHAPGMRGEQAQRYFAAGIATDHECATRDEALDKLACGAKILIREGSAARNFDALVSLIDAYPESCMLCSDDKHPHELLAGHINTLVQRAVTRGSDRMNVLRAACLNPVLHYGLDVGLLRPGDDADFVEVDNLDEFTVLRTFVRGQLVAQRGRSLLPDVTVQAVNKFVAKPVVVEQFRIKAPSGAAKLNAIEAIDGQLLTRCIQVEAPVVDGLVVADAEQDLLKIAVVNRYRPQAPAVAFVRGFGLRKGALASSVAHDSHNIIAVGACDEDLCAAINCVITSRGGLAVVAGEDREVLPLPVAGLMSTATCEDVAAAYVALDQQAQALGATLRAPFMTLSFMALLVIPEIKLSDKGLFDSQRFEFLPLFCN